MRGSLSSLPQGWGGRREFTQDPSDSRVGARLDPQMAEGLKHWGGLSRAGDGGAELFFLFGGGEALARQGMCLPRKRQLSILILIF